MKIIIVLAALLLVGVGCNKNKTGSTIVNGTVINLSENEPLAGVEVKLVEGYGTISHSGSTVIATKTTNSSGSFNFNFVATPSRWYTVAVTDLNLFLKSVNKEIIKNKTNEVVLKPSTFGYLKMEINGSEGNDSLMLHIEHQHADITGVVTYKNGDSFESSMVKTYSGNRYFKLEVFNNGSITTYFDTVIIQPYQEHYWNYNF